MNLFAVNLTYKELTLLIQEEAKKAAERSYSYGTTDPSDPHERVTGVIGYSALHKPLAFSSITNIFKQSWFSPR